MVSSYLSIVYKKIYNLHACRYNPASLGVQNVRKVAMSRGSKEGINALTKVLSLQNYLSLAHKTLKVASWRY